MWSDPIADMLTRIRNATRVGHRRVEMPSSKIKVGIAKVLAEEGYVTGFDVVADNKQGILRVDLRYGPHGEKLIRSIRRESRGGRRVYRKVADIPSVLDGLGIAILSTHRGVLSDRACRDQSVGGELLCTVS